MSLYVVFQWSVSPDQEDLCDRQIGEVRSHIQRDHSEVLSTRLYKQWAGSQPRRGYTWLEEYESLAAIESGSVTPACTAVWRPIEKMAQPGTFHTSVWFDAGE